MKLEPDGGFRTEGIFRLTYDHDAGKIPKTILTLGPAGTNAYGVMSFNRSHSNARIETKSYDKYITIFDGDGHNTHMDLDLLKGTAPDIMLVNAEQLEKYASKGVFADLTPFLDADPTIDRADLFENILGLGTIDGKQYGLLTDFGIQTLIGKTSIFGAEPGITMAELIEVAGKYPNADVMLGANAIDWLWNTTLKSMDEYVDWENGTCDFDNESFAELLNFTRDNFPIERWESGFATQNETEEMMRKAFWQDKLLLTHTSFFSGVRTAHDQNALIGEPMTFVGYPSADRKATVNGKFYAINEKCGNKQLAWEFIRQFLYEDYDNGEEGILTGFSINRNKFENDLAEEMVPLRERDFALGVMIHSYGFGGGSFRKLYSAAELEENEVKINFPNLADPDSYAITEAEAQQMRELIEGITAVEPGSAKAVHIICDEARAFLEGAKSAEETARIVQSRVSLLVGEGK
jgi:ABC-type glycerol-3-phosphate transport system substrate-binding protein